VEQQQTPWLTVKQAAARMQIGTKTVYRLVRDKHLRAAVIGGRRELRFRAEWIDDALERFATPQEIK
jgi:excisionase family DNA binding protein